MRPVSNATFVRVLYRLRAEIIREGQDGLEYVDALLRLRGADPDAQRVPSKQGPKAFGRGKLRLAILRELREGPRTGAQIVAVIAAERGWTAERTRTHIYPTLSHMRAEGHVCAPRKDNRGRLLWEQSHSGRC